MSDINLLPSNLREREQEELHRKPPPKPPSLYSKPSVLGQRLEEAQTPEPGFWQTIHSWFNKVPDPVTENKQSKPVYESKTRGGKILEEKPIATDKENITVKFANWWQGLFKSSDKSSVAVEAPKSKIPAPPLPPKPVEGASQGALSPSLTQTGGQDVPPIGVVLDVNLLPLGAQPIQVKPYTKKIWIVAGSSLFFVALIYTWFFSLITYQQVEVKKVQDQAALLADEVERLQGQFDELELVSRKMVQIKNILNGRTNWLKFFEAIESLTLPNVSFRNLSASSDGKIVLQASALTVGDLARQLQVFQQATKLISEVAISSVTVSQDEDDEEGDTAVVNTSFQIKLVNMWLQTP